tara:strand:- start:966 stop:1886 length:921 start_codon:yes stop_codon:yes gene_type:complete
MIEQLEQVKINADNISSILSRKRGALRSIKLERKRLLIKQTEDKKRKIKEQKLESKKSPFGKSIKKINKSTSTNTIFKNLGGNLLKFASLLLLGVALNNIDAIKEAVDEAFKKIREGLKTISDVIKTIYDKTENFINMFNNDNKNEDNFEKFDDEIEETSKITDKIESLLNIVNKALNRGDTDFGKVTDSGTLPTGEKFDVINLYDADKDKDMPMIRIEEKDGSTTVLTQEELNKRLNPKMKMIEREDNQWWDVLDRFPDKVKYIDVYNAASDFNIDEELKRLQKIDPERYSDTEIRIQPVYIDPD